MNRALAVAAATLLALVLVGGCDDGSKIVRGIVVSVDQTSFTHVDGFILRTADGQLLKFVIIDIPAGSGSFPPVHLRDHLASALAIDVRYEVDNGQLIALRLADAPLPAAPPAGSGDDSLGLVVAAAAAGLAIGGGIGWWRRRGRRS
ncbi:MAG: hypothetical protein ACHQ15_07605 [Candidatus Limnocylindrales bacterium]